MPVIVAPDNEVVKVPVTPVMLWTLPVVKLAVVPVTVVPLRFTN